MTTALVRVSRTLFMLSICLALLLGSVQARNLATQHQVAGARVAETLPVPQGRDQSHAPQKPIVPTSDGGQDDALELKEPHLSTPAGDDAQASLLAPLDDLRDALHVMQRNWFELWVGQWPTSIDWTGAVLNTHLVASLSTLSRSLKLQGSVPNGGRTGIRDTRRSSIENELNLYFAQTGAYYFGEDAFAIRNQAYDDILWVVLDWLESIKFINTHSRLHYRAAIHQDSKQDQKWHGSQFITAFAHRARVFYDLAARGWDTTLCGGGLTWNPYLAPYKNAITNQLFISASIAMYLYFPGDANSSPFSREATTERPPAKEHDEKYLHLAIAGYDWLKHSNMTNRLGLYTDGFHVSRPDPHRPPVCDKRNEMVYTYNQGVVLSGLRGLWEATGNVTYLEDGHELARNVVAATGWSLFEDDVLNDAVEGRWHGLGRRGILEDYCDAGGRCNQDAQAFKGIYFHHLGLFCEALPVEEALVPGKTYLADHELASLHRSSCQGYAGWVKMNAKAAAATKDDEGRFGGWWGAGLRGQGTVEDVEALPLGAVDYRNDWHMLLNNETWIGDGISWAEQEVRRRAADVSTMGQQPVLPEDLNDRGRGRTVESHSSGIAVLRCLWELLHLE